MSSKKGSKVRKSKTKAKFSESSRLNQSGNPVESQIGVAAEQPMHPAEIQRMLQLERLDPTLDDRDAPTIAGIYCPSALQPGPSQVRPLSQDLPRFHVTNVLQPPQSSSSFGDPNAQDLTSSSIASSSRIRGTQIAFVVYGYPTTSLQHHSDFPSNFNYTPLSVTWPRANITRTQIPSLDSGEAENTDGHRSHIRPTPYPPIGISPRPGETRQGERFTISGTQARQSVIRSVGQSVRVTRNTSRIRLPPSTQLPQSTMTIESIRTIARSNFKRCLFTDTLLPNSEKLTTMIREALFNAVVEHLGDGVGNWLEKNAADESRKLKDIANNIHNEFKSAAQFLMPQLHNLTLPINIWSQEAMFRQDNFSYLDDTQMVNGSTVVVPFGHPVVIQLILQVLWKDHYDYSQNLPDRDKANIKGSELEQYTELTDDIYVHGQEMTGLML
ncbi:hypothetical protein JVU11DRAFT_9355 [Chiua virens]|nr:hypothetical protein JVU11DRAFT_9355 [Chiua virens]